MLSDDLAQDKTRCVYCRDWFSNIAAEVEATPTGTSTVIHTEF